MSSFSPSDLGYSRDQFYRRVRLLADAGLIHVDRGKHNDLLLGPMDGKVLREFRKIELNYPKRGLEWCLEHLRADLLQNRLQTVTNQANYLQSENTALRKSLVTYRRWSMKRLWKRIRSLVRRDHSTRTE